MVCYFSNWASHRPGEGAFVPENLDASLCSHVFYAFAGLDTATLELTATNPRLDLDSRYYERVQETARSKNSRVKVFLSVGGWTDSSGDSYSR